MTGRLLTTRDVAELLGISPETVLRWIDTRALPARRLTSRAIRFREDELEAWLDAHATTGTDNREALTTRSRARRNGPYATLESASLTTPPRAAATTEEDP